MKRPKLYLVRGTVVAEQGRHVFKEVVAGVQIETLQIDNSIIVEELSADGNGLYYLEAEGDFDDYGKAYLFATGGVAASGCDGEGGSISSILSPYRALKRYNEYIVRINKLIDAPLFNEYANDLNRMVFVDICGEMEGFLSDTLISLIQGNEEVFHRATECQVLKKIVDKASCKDEMEKRSTVINEINSSHFQKIQSFKPKTDHKVIDLYQQILNITIPEIFGLQDDILWRDKLAHRVTSHMYGNMPNRKDIRKFIQEVGDLVTFIANQTKKYCTTWVREWDN